MFSVQQNHEILVKLSEKWIAGKELYGNTLIVIMKIYC